jgi:hypothetical protein
MSSALKYITILGERCSGTTFVEYAIMTNFGLEYYTIYRKHFFGHDLVEFNTEKMAETLLICVVRDPVDWIDSFFKRHHHVTQHNFKNIFNFLNNEFHSIYELPPRNGQEIMEDRHIITKERYRNIFELRKTKNHYMMHEVPKHVPHYLLLRYEDLRDNYDETLDRIAQQFNLARIENPYKKIIKYKGTYTAEYAKKPILISERNQQVVMKMVDIEQEKQLGYLKENSRQTLS